MKNFDKKKIKKVLLYGIFGLLTTFINIGSFYLLRKYIPEMNKNIANGISILLAIIVAYFTNRKYVFESIAKNKTVEFIKFMISRGITFVMEFVSFWLLTNLISGMEIIIKSICTLIVIIMNYIFSNMFVFKESLSEKDKEA